MKNYVVNCSINETMFIEAEDADTAADIAIAQMETGYDVAPGQAEVNSIEEIK